MKALALIDSPDPALPAVVPAFLPLRSSLLQKRRQEKAIFLCDALVDVISALSGVDSKELRAVGKGGRDIARLRQITFYVAHVILEVSMRDIAMAFGCDRTTVRHACHLVEDLRDDHEFDQVVTVAERVAGASLRFFVETP